MIVKSNAATVPQLASLNLPRLSCLLSPTLVGCAPEDVVGPQTENVPCCHGLADDAAVVVQNPFGLAGGSGCVVQDRGCVSMCNKGREFRRCFLHQALQAENPFRGGIIAVYEDDESQRRQLRPDAGKFPEEALFGDDPFRSGVTQSVQQGILAEIGEESPADDLRLECTQEGDELLRHLGQKGEKDIARSDSERDEQVGEAVAFAVQVGKGVVLAGTVGVNPTHGGLVRHATRALQGGADMADVVLIVFNCLSVHVAASFLWMKNETMNHKNGKNFNATTLNVNQNPVTIYRHILT